MNRAEDIHSLLSFLQVEPLSDKDIFRRAISNPIQSGDNDIGLTRLRTTMAYIALRRSKALVNVVLQEKQVQLRLIAFPEGSNAHKEVYNALFGSFRMAVQAVLQEHGGDNAVLKHYTSIFETLLRLRQSCCSATLVPAKRREAVVQLWYELKHGKERKLLSAAEGLALLEKLKGTFSQDEDNPSLPECAICLMEMDEQECVILRQCSHIYCDECISRVVASDNRSCPLCRRPFQKTDMVKKSIAVTAATCGNDNSSSRVSVQKESDFGTSPKILALLDAIETMQPDEKGVIFSQL